jgi:hypothetical protein
MGADVERNVETKFSVVGNAQRAVGTLGNSFSGLGGIISRVTSLVNPLNVAMTGLAGALSIREISNLGDQFEQTQITMAGFLSSLGVASDYAAGFNLASDVMDKIRVSAAALPGEAEEYIQVFKAGLPVVQKAVGGTINEMTAFTNRYTAIAKTLQVDSQQAARDLTLMLRAGLGGAGMDVRTFMQLLPFMKQVTGQAELTRESFNKMTAPERAKLLSDTFKKLDPMLAKSSDSFDAMAGAMKSNTKEIIRLSTAPLFEGMKKGLGRINALIYTGMGELTAFGQKVVDVGTITSNYIVKALDNATSAVQKLANRFRAWGESPVFKTIVGNLRKIVESFEAAGGAIGKMTGGALAAPEGAGEAAAGAAGGGAMMALGPVASIAIGALTSFASNAEAVGAVVANLSGIFATVSEVLAPVMSLFGQISGILGDLMAAVLPPLTDLFNQLLEALMPIISEVMALAGQIMGELRPVLKSLFGVVGKVIAVHVTALIPIIKILVKAFVWIHQVLADTFGPALKAVGSAISALAGKIGRVINFLSKLIGEAAEALGVSTEGRPTIAQAKQAADQGFYGPEQFVGPEQAPAGARAGGGGAGGGARGGGGRAQNDFRFSRFEITQKFAEGFDPDRIAVAFAQDVGRIGENALQSGFEPLFAIK